MKTNLEFATQSAAHFITCKHLGMLSIEDLKSDELWFNHPNIVLDYMQENYDNKAEMLGLLEPERITTWVVAFFDKIVQRNMDRAILYPYVDFMDILEKTKNANYANVEDILSFFIGEIRLNVLEPHGPELAYIIDNFAHFIELGKIEKYSSIWPRLSLILLENPALLIKFAKQCAAQRHIVYLWETSMLDGGEKNIAEQVLIRAMSRQMDIEEIKSALLSWVEVSRSQAVAFDYYGEAAVNESLDRFVSHLTEFGQLNVPSVEQQPISEEADLIKYFSESDRMTFDASFDIFNQLLNKEDTLLGLVAQLEKLDLSHFNSSKYTDFSQIYLDQMESVYGDTDLKIKALAHFRMRVRFASNFGCVDDRFSRYVKDVGTAGENVQEMLDMLLDHYSDKLIEGTTEFIAFRNLFRSLDLYWEAKDVVSFIANQINKRPNVPGLEAGLFKLFAHLFIRNIQGCIGVRRGQTLEALLDLKLQRPDGYNAYSCLVSSFISYLDSNFIELLGRRAKQIHAYTPDTALACLRTVVMESQIIASYCLGKPNNEYPLQWIRANPNVLEEAYNTAMLVKGGYDAAKHVGYKYAMIYFGSKRAKKNLFDYSKTFNSLVSYDNAFGLPAIGDANPFEKGFSWGQYEEFCKHLDVVAFSNSSVSWKKRLVAHCFANMFNDAPAVVERKVKTALGEEMCLKKLATKLARQVTALDDFNVQDWKFKFENLSKNRVAIQEFWKQHIQEIDYAVFFILFVGVTGKLPKAGMLKFIFNTVKQFNATHGTQTLCTLADNTEYCAQAYKNKTSIDIIMAAIEYADSIEAPKQKEIVLQVQDDESGLVGRTLDAGDLRALSIGDEINCCQYVSGHAGSCSKATYRETDFGVFVVEQKDKRGSKPLAESAIWLNDQKNVIVIDSIEGQRKDAVSYEKIANVYYKAILQWIAEGKKVAISNTDYGLTVQIRRKIFAKLKNNPKYEVSPKMRKLESSVYSDLGSYAYYITDQDI